MTHSTAGRCCSLPAPCPGRPAHPSPLSLPLTPAPRLCWRCHTSLGDSLPFPNHVCPHRAPEVPSHRGDTMSLPSHAAGGLCPGLGWCRGHKTKQGVGLPDPCQRCPQSRQGKQEGSLCRASGMGPRSCQTPPASCTPPATHRHRTGARQRGQGWGGKQAGLCPALLLSHCHCHCHPSPEVPGTVGFQWLWASGQW